MVRLKVKKAAKLACSTIFCYTVYQSKTLLMFFVINFAGKRRAYLVEWLNSLLPDLGLPVTASDEDLRSCLIDGTILCRILNRLRPGSVDEVDFLVSPL